MLAQPACIQSAFARVACRTLSGDATLLQPAPSPLLLLDLPFSASSLPQPGEMLRCSPRGLLGHLPLVLQQLLQARGLTPLRILIRGPPAAGKGARRYLQLLAMPPSKQDRMCLVVRHLLKFLP